MREGLVVSLRNLLVRRGILILLAAICVFFIFNRLMATEEARIAKVIHKYARAVEKRSLTSFQWHIHMGYSDSRGMDRRMLLGMLKSYFDHAEAIGVRIVAIDVEVESEDTATAGVRFVMENLSESRIREEQEEEGGFVVDLVFEKQDRSWQIIQAEPGGEYASLSNVWR